MDEEVKVMSHKSLSVLYNPDVTKALVTFKDSHVSGVRSVSMELSADKGLVKKISLYDCSDKRMEELSEEGWEVTNTKAIGRIS